MSLSELRAAIEIVGFGFEALGVVVIVLGAVLSMGRLFAQGIGKVRSPYRELRQELGGAIVLGLEFLVAGDIIRTVAVDPSLQSVAALGLIVLIRTFLSMALQLEIDGYWPWQRGSRPAKGPAP
ncbi:MAG TPA: DUF1622 domain-containing protein [Steroidobacteraceae bacterium]|nr:DUF1622 domain-containing protein [Steroidobacteraceae bacterium]